MPGKYLTFVIEFTGNKTDSTSKGGTLTIAGSFDLDFGFTLDPSASGISGRMHFAAEGVRLYSPKPEDKNAIFTVSINEKHPSQRYFLKFKEPKNLKFDITVEGSLEFSDMAVVDYLKSV